MMIILHINFTFAETKIIALYSAIENFSKVYIKKYYNYCRAEAHDCGLGSRDGYIYNIYIYILYIYVCNASAHAQACPRSSCA